VVFRHQNHILCAHSFDGSHPLLSIELRGSKHLGAGRPVSPLAIQERICAEVDEDSEFQILPFHLLRRRFDSVKLCLGAADASRLEASSPTLIIRTNRKCGTSSVLASLFPQAENKEITPPQSMARKLNAGNRPAVYSFLEETRRDLLLRRKS